MVEVLTIVGRTAGEAVWRHLQLESGAAGEVLAVYRRSLLWLAAPDQPLTLSLDPAQRGPIVLEAEGPRERLHAVLPGAKVIWRKSRLCFGPALAVDLTHVTLWSQSLPVLSSAAGLVLRESIWHTLTERPPRAGGDLGDLARAGTPTTVWVRAAQPIAEALANGLVRASEAEVTAAVAGLIGLGPGLTPAGDDFLAGCLAGLQAMQDPRAGLLAAALRQAYARTTTVSRQFLSWAIDRQYGEPIRALFAAAERGVPLQVPLSDLLAVGASSGSDTAAGIWVGLAVSCPGPLGGTDLLRHLSLRLWSDSCDNTAPGIQLQVNAWL